MNKQLIKWAIQDKINSLYSKIENNKYLAWKSPDIKEQMQKQNKELIELIKQYEEELEKIQEIQDE